MLIQSACYGMSETEKLKTTKNKKKLVGIEKYKVSGI